MDKEQDKKVMKVTVNGVEVEVPEGTTVQEAIALAKAVHDGHEEKIIRIIGELDQ